MLDGPSVEVPKPINHTPLPVKFQTPTIQNVGPSENPIEALQKQIEVMKSGVSGGATEMEATEKKVEDPNVLMKRLLKQVGLAENQMLTLPKSLQDKIDAFHPKTVKELDDGFMGIINDLNDVIKNDPKATPIQQMKAADIKAAVDSKALTPSIIFTELMKQTDDLNVSQVQKDEIKGDLAALKNLADTPTTKENVEKKKTSFFAKIPRPLQFLGLGGLAALVISIWKAMKGAMGGAAAGGSVI